MELQNRRALASGGMADIYEGFTYDENGIKKLVIEKALKAKYAAVEHFRKMFKLEISMTDVLGQNSPNHFPVVFEECSSSVRFYMEKVLGCTLKDYIYSKGRLESQNVVNIGIQLSEALEFMAMSGGIVHRDLKPDNIMIHEDEKGIFVKIIDFGLSCNQDKDYVNRDFSVGLTNYRPPEGNYTYTSKHDGRFDLYSLGVILADIWNWKDCPELEEIIDKLRMPNMQDRYQSAAELNQALRLLSINTGSSSISNSYEPLERAA